MGVLDALTILGAGVGRGYRSSQEVQRQISEQKRKALLEEREQLVSERASKVQEDLATSTIQRQAMEMAMEQFGLGEKKRTAARDTAPITPNSKSIRANILGNEVELPGTMESLTQNDALLRQLSEQGFKSSHPGYFTNYPPAGTAAAQIRNSPEARGRDYIHEILSTQLTPLMGEDEQAYGIRTAKERANKLEFLMKTDPKAINTFLEKVKSKSADSDSTDDYLDEEAIEPDTKRNRFKVTVKK